MEQKLYELDMERQYEDDSFRLDGINSLLQLVSNDQQEQKIEELYNDWLDNMSVKFNSWYTNDQE